jgi:mRNA interferase HigB
MRIIARRTLREFWEKRPDARQALQAWYADVKRADWKSPAEIKAIYRNASFLADNRVVFNVKGNQYRLIVVVQYQHGIVYLRFVGTHQEYGRIDAASIERSSRHEHQTHQTTADYEAAPGNRAVVRGGTRHAAG